MAGKSQVTTKTDISLANAISDSFDDYLKENKTGSFTFGTNWHGSLTQVTNNFVVHNLFPKLNSTTLHMDDLGNSFWGLAKEVDNIGELRESYTFMDSIPSVMDLTKNPSLMLENNFPRIASKLFGRGQIKKQKLTLNDNYQRMQFSTVGDAVIFNAGAFKNKINGINITEEKEMKAMLVQYANTMTSSRQNVDTLEELSEKLLQTIMDFQQNDTIFNDVHLASGGDTGQKTTVSNMQNIQILTTTAIKTKLLKSDLARAFHNEGIDITGRIMAFRDLGGTYELTENVTIAEGDTVANMKAFDQYRGAIGDLIAKGTIITYDLSKMKEFEGKYKEIKPEDDLFAYVFDNRIVDYQVVTKNMIKIPFNNGEFDTWTNWVHYLSTKSMKPYFNNSVIGKGVEVEGE